MTLQNGKVFQHSDKFKGHSFFVALTELELVYLAGLWDGEGWSCLFERTDATSSRLNVGINMTDKDIIQRVADLWGTKVRARTAPKKENHKQSYVTQMSGVKAGYFLMLVYPYLSERRQDKIDTIIQKWTSPGLLTPQEVKTVYARLIIGEKQIDIARDYEVSPQFICDINHNRVYNQVAREVGAVV